MLNECILFQLMRPVENALREQDYLAGLQQTALPEIDINAFVFVLQNDSKKACIKTTNLKVLFTNSFFILCSVIKKV